MPNNTSKNAWRLLAAPLQHDCDTATAIAKDIRIIVPFLLAGYLQHSENIFLRPDLSLYILPNSAITESCFPLKTVPSLHTS
jgi:hypothetical protein